MHILVVGASGYVGGRLVQLLVKRGERVTVAGRDPRGLEERFPRTRVVPIGIDDHGDLPRAVGLDGFGF